MKKFNRPRRITALTLPLCAAALLLSACGAKVLGPFGGGGGSPASAAVAATPAAPTGLSYTTPSVLITNIAMTSLSPTVTGSSITYSAPALPAGLAINASTGVISGTPTATTAATDYTVTATNAGGSVNATVNIQTGPGFYVNSLLDAIDDVPGDLSCATAGALCTLRAAIEESNAQGGATERLIVVPAGTITLTVGTEIAVTSHMQILGASQAGTIIDGNGTVAANSSTRIFNLSGGKTITLRRMTLTNAKPADGAQGGAVNSTGANVLTLSDITFSDNHINNTVQNVGGGALYLNDGTHTISNCIFSGNTSTAANGGALVTAGSAITTITNCRFSSNSVIGSRAGGAIAHRASGVLLIYRSLFESNSVTAAANGGAIDTVAGAQSMTVENSTFTGNSAQRGGAINISGNLNHFINNTISGNSASLAGEGGGIHFGAGSPGTTLNNILSGNTAAGAADNCAGAANTDSLGGNSSSTNGLDCSGFNEASDLQSSDSLLGALQDNGGSTHTMALSAGSPAIDTGLDTVVGSPTVCPAVDQRGVARPQNGTCDRGAYEVE